MVSEVLAVEPHTATPTAWRKDGGLSRDREEPRVPGISLLGEAAGGIFVEAGSR
jgi:hypothetical protein